MKLDFNLMRTILAHVEAETLVEFLKDTANVRQGQEGQLLSERVSEATPPAVRIVLTHVQMLKKAGYVGGISVTKCTDGRLLYALDAYQHLTLDGYFLLESLRTKGFMEKLGDFANSKSVPLTLETVKVLGEAMIKHILQ